MNTLPGWRNGIRERLKIACRKACGFESHPGHNQNTSLTVKFLYAVIYTEVEGERMYHVVFRNTSGSTSHGVITWSSFNSEADFEQWHTGKMKQWYAVVERGVTEERAIELCSTPEATAIAMVSQIRELGAVLSK